MLPGSLATPLDRSGGRARLDARGPAQTSWLVTDDGVRISAAHWSPARPGYAKTAIRRRRSSSAHGFTGSRESDEPAARGGLVPPSTAASWRLSLRGHGRSGGRSTLGDQEVLDLDQAVRWARHLGYERVVTVGFSMGGCDRPAACGACSAGSMPRSRSAHPHAGTTAGRLRCGSSTGSSVDAGRARAVRLAARHARRRRGWGAEPLRAPGGRRPGESTRCCRPRRHGPLLPPGPSRQIARGRRPGGRSSGSSPASGTPRTA